MTSRRQSANRVNAVRSTGPKSSQGKSVASQNALKHGLYSAALLVLGETSEAFETLRAELLMSLKPEGPLEVRMAERIVHQWWRIERAQRIERETLEASLAEARFQASDRLDELTIQTQYSLPRPLFESEMPSQTAFHWRDGIRLERILRYEGQVERALFRLLHEFERVQANRLSSTAWPVEVVGSPNDGFVSASPSPGDRL